VERFGSGAPPRRFTASDRLREAVSSLTAGELRNRSSAELARKCHCGERHFRRLFRQRYGISLVQHQIGLRIDLAKRLLQESDAKVTEVAFESGFQHLGLFTMLFKRATGTTPSRWRARMSAKRARQLK
jgi:AraC family transcriptional regulator of adaptative response / DNA-3-methyladenine glycosylase II